MPRRRKNNPKCEEGIRNDEYHDLPIANAVAKKDLESLGKIIESSLPIKNATVRDISIEQSVGEAFTGGRSTPVYYISAKVQVDAKNATATTNDSNCSSTNSTATQKHTIIKDRYFVVKLVTIPFNDDDNNDEKTKAALKRESYCIERRFYEYIVPTLKRHSIATPKLLASDNSPGQSSSSLSTGTFCWLMTDVRVQFPSHPTTLQPPPPGDASSTLWSALDWLARFHAQYWKDPTGDWRNLVWDRGGFWSKGTFLDDTKRKRIATNWLPTCQWMKAKHGSLISEGSSIGTIGTRLQTLHEPLSKFMAENSQSSRWSTLIHGDFKAANLFFSTLEERGDSNNACPTTITACAVDFQFSGAGMPAEDLAYLLFPDAHIDYWDSESRCLEYYHERLMESLILANKGGPSSLPLDSFVAFYELSRLELLIYWIGKGWTGSTVGDARLVLAVDDTLNKIESCCWMDCEKKLPDKTDYRAALDRFVNTP